MNDLSGTITLIYIYIINIINSIPNNIIINANIIPMTIPTIVPTWQSPLLLFSDDD